MEKSIIIKRKEYQIIEEINDFMAVATRDGTKYFIRFLGVKTKAFDDFKYASKRFKAANIPSPKVFVIDKKSGCAVTEYIDGPTIYDELIKHDLDDHIYEQLFQMNWYARTSMMQLDFNPQNFRLMNDKLYYLPFTFQQYIRSKDFTENDIKLWFYTNEFRDILKNNGVLLDKSRIISDYEMNKKIVLTVVKYFR